MPLIKFQDSNKIASGDWKSIYKLHIFNHIQQKKAKSIFSLTDLIRFLNPIRQFISEKDLKIRKNFHYRPASRLILKITLIIPQYHVQSRWLVTFSIKQETKKKSWNTNHLITSLYAVLHLSCQSIVHKKNMWSNEIAKDVLFDRAKRH